MEILDKLIAAFEEQIERKQETISKLEEENAALTATVRELQEVIKELRRQLGQDSHNSSKPPSSDGFKKPRRKSQRKKSGRKPGGQVCHRGAHMEIPHQADEEKQHLPEKCQDCPHLLDCLSSGTVFQCGEKRYEVDAVITTRVTEHQTMKACACPLGYEGLKGQFPENVKAYVQYGSSITVLAGLLSTYGAVSTERIHVLLGSLLGVSLSTGTITSMVSRCAEKVGEPLKEIKKLLIKSDVVHFDETGIDVNGKTLWVHNASTDQLTYQTLSKKRGQAGMDEGGILPNFSGTGVHDCWMSYWKYDAMTHAVCNAHLLRELTAMEEYSPAHKWAPTFKTLLLDMKSAKEKAEEQGLQQINVDHLQQFITQYDQILALADQECPDPTIGQNQRHKKGKERSLIERLRRLKDSVCLFIRNFAVSFDNNQAERDVRNVKTKDKVAGCFRSETGAKNYLDLMSYISTGKKHGVNAFDALTAAFSGNAFIVLQ